MDSAVPDLEDSTSVAPDSFENDQCEIIDGVKDDQSTSTIDSCTREVRHDEREVDGLTSVLQGQSISQHDKTKTVHNEEVKVVPNDEIDNIFELVGCYMLPTPISMAMLRTKGDEVFICILCGYLMENERILFIYKTSIEGETRGCPSFIGHTTIISPTSMNASGKQIILDSSSLQLIPDGKSLVLLNNIKVPYCSSPIDQCHLSTSDCMPNCIVKMKRIPKFPSLIVGHSAFGDFSLWDLTRRTLVSKFSAPTSFPSFIPISLFRHPSQPLSTSDACRKKQVEDIMEETQRWCLEPDNHDSVPVNEGRLSLVLLVSSASSHDPFDEYSHQDLGVGPAGSWRLALLAKNKLVAEKPLDPSATVVGALSGYGIIGTCDGSLYIWELSTGTKLGYLSHCRGARVSCLAADDSDSGAFAVAVDGNQLQVYASKTLAKRKT